MPDVQRRMQTLQRTLLRSSSNKCSAMRRTFDRLWLWSLHLETVQAGGLALAFSFGHRRRATRPRIFSIRIRWTALRPSSRRRAATWSGRDHSPRAMHRASIITYSHASTRLPAMHTRVPVWTCLTWKRQCYTGSMVTWICCTIAFPDQSTFIQKHYGITCCRVVKLRTNERTNRQ